MEHKVEDVDEHRRCKHEQAVTREIASNKSPQEDRATQSELFRQIGRGDAAQWRLPADVIHGDADRIVSAAGVYTWRDGPAFGAAMNIARRLLGDPRGARRVALG